MFRQALRFAAIAVLIVACTSSKATPGAAKAGPNAGRVLFGDSYDKSTFVISGQTTQAPQGKDMVYVAHFSKLVPSGQIHLLGVLNGKTLLDHAVTVTDGPWSVYGARIPGTALIQPGALLLRVVDDGNVLLATGTLNVTRAPPGASGSPGASRSPGTSGSPAPSGSSGGGDPSPS